MSTTRVGDISKNIFANKKHILNLRNIALIGSDLEEKVFEIMLTHIYVQISVDRSNLIRNNIHFVAFLWSFTEKNPHLYPSPKYNFCVEKTFNLPKIQSLALGKLAF